MPASAAPDDHASAISIHEQIVDDAYVALVDAGFRGRSASSTVANRHDVVVFETRLVFIVSRETLNHMDT